MGERPTAPAAEHEQSRDEEQEDERHHPAHDRPPPGQVRQPPPGDRLLHVGQVDLPRARDLLARGPAGRERLRLDPRRRGDDHESDRQQHDRHRRQPIGKMEAFLEES
jgi:hypothetical protein